MGFMLEGKWNNDDQIPAMREGTSFAQIRDSEIGLRRTAVPALPETDSRPNPVVITYSCLRHVPGRIGP